MNNHEGGLPPHKQEVKEMTYMYNGKAVSEDDLYDIIYEQMTEDKFEDYLNETYGPIEIFGTEFECGTTLRKVDEVMFSEFRLEECDHITRNIIDDPEEGYPYGITWEEDE